MVPTSAISYIERR